MGLRSIENRVKDEFILVMNQNELEMRVLYAQKSSQLQSQIKHRLGNAVPWRHDFIVHHLGLVGLIGVGQRVIKPIFDSLVEKTAQKFGAVALIPNVKGPERARVKVRTRYSPNLIESSPRHSRASEVSLFRQSKQAHSDIEWSLMELM